MKFPLVILTGLALAGFAGAQSSAGFVSPSDGPQPKYPLVADLAADDVAMGLGGTIQVSVRIDHTGHAESVNVFGPFAPCSNLDDPRVRNLRDAAIKAVKAALWNLPTDISRPPLSLAQFRVPYPIPPGADRPPRDINAGWVQNRITGPQPTYPEALGQTGPKHVAPTIRVLIGEDGNVIGAYIVTTVPKEIEKAALEAACKSKYPPTTLEGKPVKVFGWLTYDFIRP